MKRLLILLLLAGCSSTPDIPDDQGAVEYRSTAGEQEPAPKPVEPTVSTNQAIQAVGPIATIDGVDVPAEEFNTEIARVIASGMPPAMVGQYKNMLIEKIVDRVLVERSVAKQNIVVTDADVDKKLEEMKAEFERVSKETGQTVTIDTLLQQLRISQEELKKSIKQSIAIERVLTARGLGEPTTEQAKKFYDENIDVFATPEAVEARHILIKVPDGADEKTDAEAKARAEVAYKRATAKKADFKALAGELSEGPTKEKGGDLGFVPRGQTVPEFEDALFALKPNEVSKPVRSPFGWHIIQAVSKREAGTMPFEEVESRIVSQLKNDQTKEALDGLLTELRNSSKVELHPENIQ
ncbi:MAG: peptidylprolyl isomerase [bacterium]